ncbi:MAG: 30S ribosomal protein S9 [Desulfobacteraceae bacterium]
MDSQNVFYATGKRKSAVAKVWIKPGTGEFVVNNKPMNDYFVRDADRTMLMSPLMLTENDGSFDVRVTVLGGGPGGQAGAVKHGISRALATADPDLRGILKSEGYITRDSRQKERKKYGKRGARASYQFSKR